MPPPTDPSEQPYIQIPPSDLPSLTKCSHIIATTIGPTPICLSLIADIDNLTRNSPISPERYHTHFDTKIKQNTQAGAIAVQAGDFSAVAVWEPPNFQPGNEASNRQCSMLEEWKAAISKVEMEYLGVDEPPPPPPSQNNDIQNQYPNPKEQPVTPGQVNIRPHWHLNYLSRNPTIAPVPGAISAIVRPFLQLAIEDKVPVWLEASTEEVIPIYEHFGFRVVEKVTIGIGRFGIDGWPEEGGGGVSAWAMIFDGHLR